MLEQDAMNSLVKEVNRLTSGTAGDPLTIDEVKPIVEETVKQLRDNPEVRTALMAHGLPSSKDHGTV